MTGVEELQFSQDYIVLKPKPQRAYPVGAVDWVRLKRLINGMRPKIRLYQIGASALFGVTGSAFVGWCILPADVQGLPGWTGAVLLTTSIATLLLGGALLAADHEAADQIGRMKRLLDAEMETIEQTYESAPEPQQGL